MKFIKKTWPVWLPLFICFGLIFMFIALESEEHHVAYKKSYKVRKHTDHKHLIEVDIKTPQDATRECLKCHQQSGDDFLHSEHWTWLGPEVEINGKKTRIGKKNLSNNFCIDIVGNWAKCNKCHAGYGWVDNKFDFEKKENMDCLVCHEWSGQYVKGTGGYPVKGTDLNKVARSVGYPKRNNCGMCHYYGGGGANVKHGDLSQSLNHPTPSHDVHMGRSDMLCIDCHKANNHNIQGTSFGVSVNHDNGISCLDCHQGKIHHNERITEHLASVECQTCHVPDFANYVPTKMEWDWSTAGNKKKKEDYHKYMAIKGDFRYGQAEKPEYYWFNYKTKRYLNGDKIDPKKVTGINALMGDINDLTAKISPFKVHRGKQTFDKKFNYLLSPVTAGKDGYWTRFDWNLALTLASNFNGLPYSGKYGFAPTEMHWRVSHMIPPKEGALKCDDCHGKDATRMNWEKLGYDGDPIEVGGRD